MSTRLTDSNGNIFHDADGNITLNETMLAMIKAIPTADPEDGATIWNDGGVLKVATSGG